MSGVMLYLASGSHIKMQIGVKLLYVLKCYKEEKVGYDDA